MRSAHGVSAPVILTIIALFLAITPRLVSADWPTLGRAVCTAPADQKGPKVTTDGAAGAIVVWQDLRSARVNVFARRVLASGELDPAWPIDGRALLADSTALADASGGQAFPVIAPDGAGGAIVAWQDDRSSDNGLDIFAQHVLASGVVDPAWPANGRALCTAPGQQARPTIVSDGAGGAIVTWMDSRISATEVDVFAQHVLPSGVVDPDWPVNGVALSTAPEPQAFPRIVSDGSGGAIVTWFDFRPGATGIDIYAQRVTGAGIVDPDWPLNGRALCLAPGAQVNPSIVSDGEHGAIVTWEDPRDGTSHVFAQRVTGAGTIAAGWPADGRAVCTAPIAQFNPIVTSDGASGAIIAWEDARNSGGLDIFAQRVLASGAIDPNWPVDGRALTVSSGHAVDVSMVPDGAGGAIVAWEEDFFVLAHHIQASGQLDPEFPANGRFVRLTLDFERTPDLVAAGAGEAVVAWSNAGSGTDTDIYANLVVTSGTVDVDHPGGAAGITLALPSPNPARASLTLRFTLPQETDVRLALYDVTGRRVRQLASGTRPAGEHVMTWDLLDEGGAAVGAGLFFARLEAGGRILTRKLATLR